MSTRGDTARQRPLDIATARHSHEALLVHLDGLAAAVVRLHAPVECQRIGGAACDGCDFAGWEAEPPVWPCRTIRGLKAEARKERRAATSDRR